MFKKGSHVRTQMDVNDVIREVLTLVDGELRRHSILVETELTDHLPKVSGVRVQLQQVMVNLITNAIEAMGAVNGRARQLRVSSALREPDNIVIAVADSGPGIETKNVDQIFDPFFTTKSHGMGMGLSICRSIVETHSGRLSVSPCADGGSMFQIALPARQAPSA